MLQNNITVLPTTRAIRHYINSKKNQNQFLDKLIPIGDFFQLAIIDKKNRKQIDKSLKIIYLKEAIKNIDIASLGLSADFNSFFKQSDYIFRFFNEMAMEYIKFDDLLDKDTYIHYSDHIELLKIIYKNYIELLDKNNFIDNILLPNEYIINNDFVEQYSTITIYVEGYLSKFEFNIIKEISKLTQCKLKLNFNKYNAKNKKLIPSLQDQLEDNYSYTINLTNQIIEDKVKLTSNTKHITITPIPSQIEQIAFVKYQVSLMVNSGLDPSNIVVITPNEKIVKIMQLFDSENYFNFAMGISIEDSKILQVLQLVSKIIVDKEPKDEKKFEFLHLDDNIFNKLFRTIWTNIITKEIFDDIMSYIFTLDARAEILEQLEQIRISLEILLFKNITENFEKILVKDFIKILQSDISKITIDDTRGGKITVMGILETRLIEFDGVIIIDFNDDKIPKISIKDKFLSSNLKQKVGLPTITDRENLQRYYYQRLFDKAESLAIGYIEDDASVMSRFIVELFPNYKQYLVKNDFKSILYTKQNIFHFYKDIVLDIDLSKLEWSATSLKEYLSCKRQFYYHYIAKIKDHTISIKPQAYEIGNILHNALELAVKEKDFNKQFIDNYITQFEKYNPFLILELELWKKKLEKFMEYEAIRFENGIKIFEVEKEFKIKYNDVRLKGKIDRIDQYPDNSYEILDYKTSASLKIDTVKSYKDSKDFQLEFYYLASRDKMIKNVAYYDLNDASIKSEVMLQEKLELLDVHLKALKTIQVDFKMCEDKSNCLFCSYQIICDRG